MFVPSRNKSDLIAASCLAAFGGYVTYVGSKLSYTAEVGPGSGFFPFWIGIGLLIFSSYQGLTYFTCALPPNPTPRTRWRGADRALGGWLAMTTSIFLCRWLGFAASFVLLTGFFIVVLERRTALRAFAIGVTLALAFHLLFVVALGVSLPAGPWGF